MNISGYSNVQPYLPMVNASPVAKTDNSEEASSAERVISPSVKQAIEKPFYEYEGEPWLTDPAFKFPVTREEYLFYKYMTLQVELTLLKDSYSVALVDLADAHPDIAAKNFSVTMGEDGGIKIIDNGNNLSDEDIDTLMGFLNDAGHLKSRMQAVVKHMLMLANHDHDTFGGRYDVGIETIHRVLDIGKVLNESADMMQKEWIRQIKENAEELSISYVSVSV